MALNLILLGIMVIMAIWTVMNRSLLKAAIGLAVVSVIITIFMFRFDCPLAAVFELSVCAGLITVIFLSTIGLTKPLAKKEIDLESRERVNRYRYLPLLVILAGVMSVYFMCLPMGLAFVQISVETDVRGLLWNSRQLDLFGQIIILLAGGFGAVILFKEKENNEW
jgi:NADH-quinone oxidoreductase subunit J